MATNVSEIVKRTRRILQDFPWETTLSVGISDVGTTVNVPDGTEWDEGDVGEFEADGDQFYVQSVSANALTVVRGYNDTTAAAHSSGDRIFKNPVFGREEVADAAKHTLRTLWPYAWVALDVTVTHTSGDSRDKWYSIDGDIIDLVSVSQLHGTSDDKLGVFGETLPVVFKKNLPTVLVASGTGVQFPNGVYKGGNTIYVRGRKKLTDGVTASAFDDVSDPLLEDVVVYGAAAKLVHDKEVQRVTQEDVSQGDASVEPLRRTQSAAFFRQRYEELRNQLYMQRLADVPPMMVYD